jgi:hypothetical protein
VSNNSNDSTETKVPYSFMGLVGIIVVIAFCGGLYGCPQYNVYSERMSGEAALAKAVGERQAIVETARAQEAAAKLLAGASEERAKGWATAAKDGCVILNRPNDVECERTMLNHIVQHATAVDGHGTTMVFAGSSSAPVAVNPAAAVPNKQ